MSSYVLEVHDVAVQFGGVSALDGVSFNVEKGQIMGLIGPNGAGKSTVINAITGRVKTKRGSITLLNEEVSNFNVIERRARGVSRSFQRTSVFGGMAVRRQVELASYKMGGGIDSVEDTQAVLTELGLEHLGDAIAQDLGYGEQRRLDLALALAGRPKVLLLDEPLAGLSIQESVDMAEHLKNLASRWQVSVLLVEHDMDVVFGISDAVTVFELGCVIASGTPDEIRANARVREAYLGSAA